MAPTCKTAASIWPNNPSLALASAFLALSLPALPLPLAAAASGLVEPLRQATLASTIVGRIERILVAEGDSVEEGQVLIELERSLETLEMERRRLVAESVTELAIARERAALREAEWRTTVKLRQATQSVSQEEENQKEIDYKIARAEVDQLAIREQIEALEFKIAQEQWERRLIRAPNPGTVTRVHAQPGEICEVRQPLLTLVNASSCHLVANLEPSAAARLSPGQSVRVRLDDPRGEEPVEVLGTVASVAAVIDPASGLRRVRVLLPNPAGRITPGVVGSILGL